MAQVLTGARPAAHAEAAPAGWWPVDRLIFGYLAASAALIGIYFGQVPGAGFLLSLHLAGMALIVAAAGARPRPGSAGLRLLTVFRHWYPLPFVASCYKVSALLIPPMRGVQLDEEMARIDRALWGADPTIWLERVHSPWLTEFLQIAYALFVPAVLLVAVLLWRGRRLAEFRYYAFLISLGFLASYVGYVLAPVRGPRFLLAHLQHIELRGLWLFGWLQRTLDQLESAHYDCFPSGHTELTLLAWWSTRRISMKLFRGYTVYSILIVVATVYLRYHYTIDVFAGAALAFVLLAGAPHLYRTKRPLIGRRD
jgi:membrane-associated phospholipid phosphatase